MTTEEKKEKKRAQDRIYRKRYRVKNREKLNAEKIAYRKSVTLPYNIIYCIPNYDGKGNDYVGITNQPMIRMHSHKSLGKLNTGEYIELDRVDTRAEALILEAEYHDKGYHGAQTGRPMIQANN